jgi:hypothetical protein
MASGDSQFAQSIQLDRVEISAESWCWDFASARRAEIDEHFARFQRKRSAVWNGRMLLLRSFVVHHGAFVGRCFETDYASFIAWRDWGFPDPTIYNFFAVAALRAADGAYLVGEMAPYTAGAGRLYFPCGTPTPAELNADGVFDLIHHLGCELREETGIGTDELDVEPGWVLVRDGHYIALLRRLTSRDTADALRRRVLGHIAAEPRPELCGVHIVRGLAQLDARMPRFVQAFLRQQWQQ